MQVRWGVLTVPTAEVRARQKEVLAEIGASRPFVGIVVIERHGLLAHLGRSNMATSWSAPSSVCVAADRRSG